ncbi:CBS domain-containing protein [Candidatus Marsarchaeota archaeon]|jgi:CBS domain-containing protein|nr:CBS domain-containing protein [Candidatus Marsarchaeota archaeon]MCL5099706.1 CBS domain-containing protein [Candidatus Marsarchaeota archaeon]
MAENKVIPEGLLSRAPVLDVKTPVTKIIPIIDGHGTVVVTKAGEFYGIVDSRAMYRSNQSLAIKKNATVEKYAVRTPKITASTPIDDVVAYFYKSQSTAMPFIGNGKIKGVLDRYTLLRMLLSLGYLKDMTASEVMTSPVLAIDVNANVSQARAAMAGNKLNRLIVMDNGRFVGLLTNHDIVAKYSKPQERLPEMKTKVYSPANVPVGSVMEGNPVLVDQTAKLEECVRNFIERRISSVIVTARNEPVGIITISDVLEALISRRRISENRIILSGFDADSYQYEDEVREMVREFMDKAEKLQKLKTDYVTIRIKKLKGSRYEVKMRAILGKYGAVAMDHTGFMLDRTVGELLDKMRSEILKRKDKVDTYKYRFVKEEL